MCKNNDDTSTTEMWDDLSDYSLSSIGPTERRASRRRSSTSIMKAATLDESLHSTGGTAKRRSSSCRMPVSFDIVEIREHAIILDESRNGPALTIDWKAINTGVTTVQELEITREIRKVRLLPLAERVAILVRAGYSVESLCDHFAENVEDAAAKKEAHPKKCQKQAKTQNDSARVLQKSLMGKLGKVKKAAKKLKKQVSNSSITAPLPPGSKVSASC